jgi:autotransporter-associated beta strand protein
MAGQASAAPTDYTWNVLAGGTWTGSTTWAVGPPSPPGNWPGSGTTSTITSGAANTGTLYFTDFLYNTSSGDPAYAVTTSLATFDCNSLAFTSQGGNVSTFTPTIQLSIATGTTLSLSANSINPTSSFITQNGSGQATITSSGTSTLLLNNATFINGSGLGNLILSATLSGSGPLTINQTGTAVLDGGSQITLSGSNGSYAPGVTLTNGNLVIGSSTALGSGTFVITAPSTSNSVRFSVSGLTIANAITLSSTLNLTGGNGATFTGAIGGNGGININENTPSSSVTYTFQNAISGTGAINVNALSNGTVTLTLSSQSSSVHGTALSASAYTLQGNNGLVLDNTTANATRLNSSATLTLGAAGSNNGSGNLVIIGNASTATAEQLAGLTVNGGAVLGLTPTSTQPITLTLGSLTRLSNGTTLAFNVLGGGATPLTLGQTSAPSAGNASVYFSGGLTGANAPVNGILPYAYALTGLSSSPNVSLVRYSASNGIQPLSLATDYSSSFYLTGSSNPTANFLIAPNNGTSSAVVGLNAPNVSPVTANALVLQTQSGAFYGNALYGSNTITLGGSGQAGVILTSVTGGTQGPTVIPSLIVPGLSFGSSTAYIQAQANLMLTGSITGSAGLVKGGGSPLFLSGDNSGLSGGLTINQGSVNFAADNNLGAAGQGITLNNGFGIFGLNFAASNQVGPGSSQSVTVNRPITLGPGGGTVGASSPTNQLTLGGTISGGGFLYVTNNGVVQLTGTNTYTGNTVLFGGTLRVSSDSNLGAAVSNLVLQGGVLQLDASMTTSRSMLVTNAPLLLTQGNDLTLNGILTSSSATGTFIKDGPGNMTLTAANPYTGIITVGDRAGSDLLRGTIGVAAAGGAITLSGPNGALTGVSKITMRPGSGLVLDNSGNINSNRLAGDVELLGGSFTVKGNANASVSESISSLNTFGLEPVVTLVQPSSGGVGLVTSVTAIRYTINFPTVFFRGTNLGAATGDRTQVFFNTNPSLAIVNGIIPSAVGAASETSEPTNFVNAVSVNGGNQFAIQLVSSTGTIMIGSSTPTVNAIQSATALFITSNTKVNSLLLGPSGGLGISPGATFSLNSGALLANTGPNGVINGGNLEFKATSPTEGRITVASNSTLTISSTLSTNVGLNKAGNGVLTLTGSTPAFNSGTGIGFSGVVQLSAGTLRYGVASALPSPTIVIAPGATLDLNNQGTQIAPVSINGFMATLGGFSTPSWGTVSIGFGALADSSSLSNDAFLGSFTGTGSLLHTGSGLLYLNGNSPSFNGPVIVSNGGLALQSNVNPSSAVSPGPLGTGLSAIQLGDPSNSVSLQFDQTMSFFGRNIVVTSSSTASNVQLTLPSLPTHANGTIATIASNISINNYLTLSLGDKSLTSAGAYTFTGVISDGTSAIGTLVLKGGNINLQGNNTYTGGTILTTGGNVSGVNTTGGWVVGVSSDSAFGTGPITIGSVTLGGGATLGNTDPNGAGVVLRADNGSRTLTNAITFATSSQILGVTGLNDLTFNGTVSLGTSTPSFNIVSAGTTTFTNVISGTPTGGATKNGGGTLVLSGANTFTNGFTLNAGILGLGSDTVGSVTSGPVGTGTLIITGGGLRAVIGSGTRTVNNPITVGGNFVVDGTGNLQLGGAVDLNNTATFVSRTITVTNTATTTLAGVLSASGTGGAALVKDGPGLLVLAAPAGNTYGGGSTVSGGTLNVAATTTLGSGGLTLTTTGSLASTANLFGPLTISSLQTGTLGSGAATVNFNGSASTVLTVNQSIQTTYAGILAGPGGLVLSGGGTLTLSGANTYAAGTTISGGTLLVANTSGSATGTGNVVVNNTGTLSGIGSVGGSVTVNSVGTIGAGSGVTVGNLAVGGSLSVDNGGSFAVVVSSTHSSTVNITGALSVLNGGSRNIVLYNDGSLDLSGNTTYTNYLVASAGSISGSSGFTVLAGNFPGFLGTPTASVVGTNLFVNFTPAPEPGSVLLLGAAAAGAVALMRRLRRPPHHFAV